ncbi:MAG TPA: hypothetical protein VGB97_03220 [Candidatus Paceibacterota bacterium]|jgi:hypothetical protein
MSKNRFGGPRPSSTLSQALQDHEEDEAAARTEQAEIDARLTSRVTRLSALGDFPPDDFEYPDAGITFTVIDPSFREFVSDDPIKLYI